MTCGTERIKDGASSDLSIDAKGVTRFTTVRRDGERLPGFCQTLFMLTTLALSLALGIYGLCFADEVVGYYRANDLEPLSRQWLLPKTVAVVTSLPIAVGVSLSYWAFSNARTALAAFARRSSPFLLTAFLPGLFCWQLWADRELPHLLFTLALVLATKQLVHYSLSTPKLEVTGVPWLESVRRWAERCIEGAIAMQRAVPKAMGFWLVFFGVVYYASFFSYHTIVHHRNVLSASFDLGLEENIIYNVWHGAKPILKSSPLGGPVASHLGSHATWFAFLLAPLYALWQTSENLLVIQAVLMGAAAIPLYLLARRFVSVTLSVFVAYCYLFFPGLHGANLYDFHYLPLGPFFLWFVLYFTERKRWFWVVLFALISLSVREDVAVALGFLGGLWLLSGRRPVAALGLLVLGAGYFVVMKGIVMHRAFGGGDAFVHQYKLLIPEGDKGFSGVVKTILSNPLYTLSTMLERQKLIYFLQIMLPLAFLPMRRFFGLWACVPGLLFALLSTEYPPLLKISFQYTTYWSAQLFPAMVLTLYWMDERVRVGAMSKAWKASWLSAVAVALLANTYQYGALLQHNTVEGGFGRYHFGSDTSDRARRHDLGVLLKMIPRNAKVVSSENIVPQLSNRADAYTLRIGAFDAEYFLFRLPCSRDEGKHVVRALAAGTHGVVKQSGEFVLAKRGHSIEKNDEYISRLGGRRHDED